MLDPREAAAGIPYSGLPPEGGELRLFRLDLLRAMQLHKRLVMVLTLLGLAAAVVETVRVWPVYKAESQVYIQPAAPRVLEQGSNNNRWAADAASYESYVQQQVQSVSQPQVLLDALHRLRPGLWQRSGESDQEAAARMGKSIKTERIGSSYQITITAQANSADAAAQIANALAASLIDNVARQQKAGNPERIAMLQEERSRIQSEMNADHTEQEALSKQLGVAAVTPSPTDVFQSENNDLRSALVKARADHDDAAARLASLGGGKSSTSLDAMADEIVATDPGLSSMKQMLEQRRSVLVTQMANLTPNNPQYKQDAAELAQIENTIASHALELRRQVAARIEQRMRADLNRTAEVEEKLNAQVRTLAGTAADSTPRLQRAADLVNDLQRLQNRFSAVDDQLHNLLLENSAPGAAFLSAAAIPPLHPSYGVLLRRALPLALSGFLLATLLAIALHRFDTRIYVAADVERVLGAGPMAQLPELEEVTSGVGEEHFFRLSAALEHAHQQGGLRSCIFTGVGPGVGVSTIAAQVKAILATMGRATTMVDTSGTPPPPATPAEAQTGASTSLVAMQRGNRSTALLQKFAEEKDRPAPALILTDTAPLLISAETEYLARFVDAVIVVIQSGRTTRGQLRAVANTLQRLEVKAAGFVLNRIRLGKADPVFRQAAMDMEQHQRAQLRSGRKEGNLAGFGLPAATDREEEKPDAAPMASLAAENAARAQALGGSAPAAALTATPSPASAESSPAADRFSSAPSAQQPARREYTSQPAPADSAPRVTPLSRNPKSRSERDELAYRYERSLEENRVQRQTAPAPQAERPAATPAAPALSAALNQTPLREQRVELPPVPAPLLPPVPVVAPQQAPSFTEIFSRIESEAAAPPHSPVPAPDLPLPSGPSLTASLTELIAQVKPEMPPAAPPQPAYSASFTALIEQITAAEQKAAPEAIPEAKAAAPQLPHFGSPRNLDLHAGPHDPVDAAVLPEEASAAESAAPQAEFWPPAPAAEFYDSDPLPSTAMERIGPAEILPPRQEPEEPLRETSTTYTPPNMRPWQQEEDEILTLPFKRGQYQGRRRS
jgi:capsular polysaccharide biosynthesis protein/Mrp family chromosome partitioning ATPase